MSARFLAPPIAALARFVAGVQVTWSGGMPPQDGQTIYFANHSSTLDFFVVWSSLPARLRARTRPIGAQDYWSDGVRGWFAQMFNVILVPRHEHEGQSPDPQAAAKTIDRIATEMGDRYSIVIFPEGTRGSGDRVMPFKSGLYYLCRAKPNVRLVPGYLENLNRILPKGESLPVPFISRLTFGAPMSFDASESKQDFLARARTALCALKPDVA